MKTSNKLLLGFLIFILAVPLCFLMALKYKVKRAEFIMEDNSSIVTGTLEEGYKVIKIEGISNNPDLLVCRIRPSYSNKYEYSEYNGFDENNGHVTINKQGDSLLVKYIRTAKDNSESYNVIVVNLYVPDRGNIVVSDATTFIDSINLRLPKLISIKLQKQAKLYVGTDLQGFNRYLVKRHKDGSYTTYPKPVSTIQAFDSVNIVGEANSKVVLAGVDIKTLLLNMQSNSSLNILYRLKVDNISGEISKDAIIKANIKGLKVLQPLLR